MVVPAPQSEPGAFAVTGASSIGDCDTFEAETNATGLANQACEPLVAKRVSEWEERIVGYCRQVYATAKFSCAQTSK